MKGSSSTEDEPFLLCFFSIFHSKCT